MSEMDTPSTDLIVTEITEGIITSLRGSGSDLTSGAFSHICPWVKKAILDDDCRNLERERNALKTEIEGLENKYKAAVDMAARAEIKRDRYKEALQRISDPWAFREPCKDDATIIITMANIARGALGL